MTGKEKVVFFVDYESINRTAREKCYRLDYEHLLRYIGEERFLIDAYCYIPINPRSEHRLDGEIEEFWRSGYMVTTKLVTLTSRTYTCNFAVEIALDMLKAIQQTQPAIVVLATGDAAFLPLVQEVRRSGVRIEVAGFREVVSRDMQLKCSGFIDLAVYHEGYLATQHDEQDEEHVDERYTTLIQTQMCDAYQVGEEGVIEQAANSEQRHEAREEDEQPASKPSGRKTGVLTPDTDDETTEESASE